MQVSPDFPHLCIGDVIPYVVRVTVVRHKDVLRVGMLAALPLLYGGADAVLESRHPA